MKALKLAARPRKTRSVVASAAMVAAATATAAIASICLALASCSSDLSDWYPSGAASIAASREFAEGGRSGCEFTIKVANDGDSAIGAYTISLSAATSARTYFTTFDAELLILPGCHAYFDGSIRFDDEAETLLPNGLTIVCDYYR